MANEPITIVGINPGTRYLGVAVLKGSQLREWRIKLVNRNSIEGKVKYVESIMRKLIERYKPDAVALKKLHPSRSSTNLDRLVQAIRQCANERKIKLCEYSLSKVETLLLHEDKTNRWKLAEYITAPFPVLNRVLRNELNCANPYYIRMFEAVALSTACFQEIECS